MLLCLQLSLLLLGCPKARPSPGDGGEVSAQEKPAAAEPEGFVLTEEKVKAWLAYQDRLRGIGGPVWDGGALPVFNPDQVRERLSADERARREVGLRLEDVQRIEELISVLAASRLRWFLGSTAGPGSAPAPEQPTEDTERPALDPQVSRAMAQLKREEEASLAMVEERARHGDQAITLLLRYEKPLLTAWMQLLNGSKETR